MSDDFIPLNQSTPIHNPSQKRWKGQNFHHSGQLGSWNQNSRSGGFNKSGNNFKNVNNKSQGKDQGIDAYLHTSMLQDPWSYLRRKNAENQSS